MVWNRHEHFASDRGNDRHDHDGENNPGGEHAAPIDRASEKTSPPKRVRQSRSNVLPKQGDQHKDGPHSIDHRRYGREELRQV